MRKSAILGVLALGLFQHGAAVAHPHIFIDTAFTLVVEGDRVTAVRVDWAYDEFYTMLMIEEYGLDGDGDGLPDSDLLDAFAGQDVDWDAGFPGHFALTQNGRDVALAGPVSHAARFENNRVITSHTRPLETPVPVDSGLIARAYDPSYFVAYDVPEAPAVAGATACRFEREEADRKAAQAEYGEKLAAIDRAEDPFEVIEIPDIGILFADSFHLRCGS
jgi:ABC-type uncharacterized transport system substrate-binding protein